MDFQRAREIVESPENIRVIHNGTPVWIEGLSAEKQSATIKPLFGQWGTTRVPVTDLEEVKG